MSLWKRRRLLEPGAKAPEFCLPRLDGGETTLGEISGNGPALLVFFKITCPVCQLTLPFLERIHSAGSLPVYGISQNGVGETREFNREFGITFPTLLDTEDSGFPASEAFGISSVPTMFLVEGGAVSHVVEGWRKAEIEWLGGKAGVRPFRPSDHVPEWKAG